MEERRKGKIYILMSVNLHHNGETLIKALKESKPYSTKLNKLLQSFIRLQDNRSE